MNCRDINPRISIIVPVYNVEAYLPACLDSLLTQTYSNIEILLVDDGTPDNSGRICDEYADKDQRIRVFHLKNGGVSSARNYAIERATGDYVCFVDSDDEVKDTYVQHFVESICEDTHIYISGVKIVHDCIQQENIIYSQNGICGINDVFSKNKLCGHGYAWAKCYNLSKLRSWGVKFNSQVKFSEDLLFVLECLQHTDKICYIPFVDYLYYIRASSASSKIYPLEVEVICYTEIKKAVQQISSKYHINLWNVENVGEIIAMLFARVRNAMYQMPNIASQTRVRIYRSLSEMEINNMYSHRYINNVMVRIGYWFLKKEMYKVADLYFKIIYKIK